MKTTTPLTRTSVRAALAAFAAAAIAGGAGRSAAQVPQERAAAPAPEGKTIQLRVGRSAILKAPWKVTRISVTDPLVADVQALTPDQVLVMGKSIGSTDVILWSEAEEAMQSRVEVDEDLGRIQEELARLFPHSTLEVTRTRDVLVVKGLLAKAEHASQLRKLLEASGQRHVDMTSVAGVQQVQIQVRVAEVSRTAIRALGINALHTGPHFFGASTIGSSSGGATNRINVGPPEGATAGGDLPFVFNSPVNVSPLVSLFTGFPDADLQVFLQALAENQYLRILAEPNLVAMSGEEASFLAGGEFPIPVVQGGSSITTSITIEYREFGVRLKFRPTVLGDGTIRLEVAPEVSDLTDVGAIEIQGFRVPSLLTRRAQTTLELESGQTFAMAGLLNRRNDARTSRVPLLGDIPVLGALFRSVRYQSGETEMVVLVTASLVEPLSTGAPPSEPGAMHTPPDDWELFAGGRIEGEPPSVEHPRIRAIREMGLDRLRGPGSWGSYDRPAAPSRADLKPEEAGSK
ncbi:MAG: type II and III secretion system protein family protein [Planctomycetes bacterium]|nr:type II and III secretion system protein family protein [Planctomycetota bacterium]